MICQRTYYGTVSLKEAKTLLAIKELKNYCANEESEKDQESRQSMIEALEVHGFAAWIIHGAIKRNNNKNRKGLPFIDLVYRHLIYHPAAQQAMQPSTLTSSANTSAGECSRAANAVEVPPARGVFDPVRNVKRGFILRQENILSKL